MFWIKFGKWNVSHKRFFVYERILKDGYKWTPFVRIFKRSNYGKALQEKEAHGI